ncbi:DUF917 domain-containing protein [Crossiella sp. CA-258035]|uniref:DUF917 domain-containing protein n=1 Tax=Crossiella sp. CA-258035 TaxID=2981138 RepID=UPI0024BD0DD5|nr:DUF917 domain-containing protein [Crossiella sp. CA-258035]WHT20140.1 DUF917 domain-containing protein [Crossiella sp. CA-258035]
MTITQLTAEDVPVLMAGAQLLSSSAGSITLDGYRAAIEDVVRRNGPVPLVALDDLPPEALCVSIGALGGYAPMIELPPNGDEGVLAVRALEERLGRKVDAIVSLNSAGPNAVFPVAAAAALGLPLVDCDGMGRVLPLMIQTTYALAGLPIGPLAGVGLAGDVLVLDSSMHRSELLLRAAMKAAGGWLMCASYPATVAALRPAALRGATSRTLTVGRMLTSAQDRESLLAGLTRIMGSRVLGSGRVIELGHATRTVGPRIYPSVPTSIVVAEYGSPSRLIRLEGNSELLLAVIDGALAAAVPDVLCLLDRHERKVVGMESVTLGHHVDVLMLPVSPMWHTPAGLAIAGPRAFGFPVRHPREEGPS